MTTPAVSVLDFSFESRDLRRTVTVREWCIEMLSTLWIKGETFDGKRPFGNSGWQYDLFKNLIAGGFIQGTLDEDGYVQTLDTKMASEFVLNEIIRKL